MKQNENGNYIIHLLGKNGEPKKNHEVNVHLYHKYQGIINKDSIMWSYLKNKNYFWKNIIYYILYFYLYI